MLLPTTKQEMKKLGWDQLDIILINGDTYIDSPYSGIAVIGRLLVNQGYKVGIIAQPDVKDPDSIKRLGKPSLYWGVSAGCVDSMVANYTANKKFRNTDDMTPGEVNNRRPDRASIVYTSLIRKWTGKDIPVVLGGIEASLRRCVHYDFWNNSVRQSILFNAQADYLVFGMGEKATIELTNALRDNQPIEDIRGLAYMTRQPKEGFVELPSYQDCKASKKTFGEMFKLFYKHSDPKTAKGLYQLMDSRYLILNPPAVLPSREELDSYYELGFSYDVHPYYKQFGKVRAMDTINFSVTTHRGCYGECNFCAITVHQGITVVSRSQDSIINEVKDMASRPNFKGIIHDLGGPTANMYDIECVKKEKVGICAEKRCMAYTNCQVMRPDHSSQIELLKKAREVDGVKKINVASGIRYDMILEDPNHGKEYLRELMRHHVGGQMKIAPEHTEDNILHLMGKPGKYHLKAFKKLFEQIKSEEKKKQFLTYYMIAAHPGSKDQDMKNLSRFCQDELQITPEQVQIFTPTPSTFSTMFYYLEEDMEGKPLFVEKDPRKKQKQKDIITRGSRPKKVRRSTHNKARRYGSNYEKETHEDGRGKGERKGKQQNAKNSGRKNRAVSASNRQEHQGRKSGNSSKNNSSNRKKQYSPKGKKKSFSRSR